MPKMKRSKSLRKRVKVTATGKVKAHHSGHGHLLSNKTGQHLRHLRSTLIITGRKADTFKDKLLAHQKGRRVG